MEYLKEIIFGKKICLIGGSPLIMNSNLGRYIDSHDIITRANCHWPVPKCFENNVSIPTDHTGTKINAFKINFNY